MPQVRSYSFRMQCFTRALWIYRQSIHPGQGEKRDHTLISRLNWMIPFFLRSSFEMCNGETYVSFVREYQKYIKLEMNFDCNGNKLQNSTTKSMPFRVYSLSLSAHGTLSFNWIEKHFIENIKQKYETCTGRNSQSLSLFLEANDAFGVANTSHGHVYTQNTHISVDFNNFILYLVSRTVYILQCCCWFLFYSLLLFRFSSIQF